MSDSQKTVGIDIEAMLSMKEFIISHEEIAASSMRRIRDAVVNRRDFLAELIQLYNEVKKSYKQEIKGSHNTKGLGGQAKLSVLKKINKTVCVLLSTNTSLYGDIVRNTYDLFNDYQKKENGDSVIVGKVGRRVFEADKPGVKFTYFDFPDTTMDNTLLKAIALHIIQYEKVVIFHSKFQSLVRQVPTAFVISESKIDETASSTDIKYIFEPSMEKIMEYFEKEIFSSIFEQTMHESQLSKFASRMVTLDQATDSIKSRLSELNLKERLLHHQIINKQQLNSITRLVMWKRNS